MHKTIDPAIHYWGTPVVLLSTLNDGGSANLSPMSSAWWLGWTCVLGLDATSQTTQNLLRDGECVLNLPSADLVQYVDRLARTTGTPNVPLHKRALGFEHVGPKFAHAGLTPTPSEMVAPPRVKECPVQLEAVVEAVHEVAGNDPHMPVPMKAVEVRLVRVHVHESILNAEQPHRIDPDKWQPLIMSFRQFYGLGDRLHPSRLAEVSEDIYRGGRQPESLR